VEHLKGVISQSMTLQRSTAIHGIVNGNLFVEPSVMLNVIGIVNGDIKIATGARVEINGMLNGNINNEGTCSIYGTVKGHVTNLGGILYIDPDASVNEK
jgi:cytoskeletal protein CcmA (bactofilin family)